MLKRKLVRLVSGTVVTSMLFSTIIQAKPKVPTGTTMIMADTYLEDTAPKNVYNLTQQMVERGFSGTDLDVLYVQQTGGSNRAYHNLNKFYDVDHPLPGNETATLWDDVKYKFDASANNGRGAIVPIDGESNTTTTTIQVRSGFTSFVKLDGNILKLSDEATFGELKKMIEATDKSNQVYTAKLGDKEITDADKLETGNTYNLIVTAEDGEAVDSSTYTIEVSKSGGSVDLLPTPAFTKDGNLSTEPIERNVGDADVTLKVEAKVAGDEEAKISYEWYSIGEEQDIPSSDLLRYYDLPESNLVGKGQSFTFTPSKVGTTYYFATAINGEGEGASKIQSNLATVIVKEGELTKDEFSVGDYVYNNQSDSTDTMGMIEGTALKNTEITIEANFSKLATATAGDDGKWKATFPRQNAGTVIKVTATLGGKSFTKDITVKTADDNDIRAFRESVDLNDLIEKRDNLYWSEDNGATGIKAADLKDNDADDPTPVSLKSGDYWIDNKDSVEAFKAYVDLIEKVLDYKYQISDVDLKYMESIAKPTVDILNEILNQVDGDKEATSKLTLSVGGNGNGTLAIKDKDAGAIVKDDSTVGNIVYILNNNKKVTITATPNASNAVAGWLVDEQPSVGEIKNLKELELSINKDTSVQAIFAPEKDAPIIQKVIDIVKEITNNGEKPFEVSISNDNPTLEEIKTSVESTIKAMLPEGAEVDKIKIEEAKTRATKNYTATVTFKVGDVTFTITIEISVNTGVSEVDLTLKLTGAEHGTVVSVMQEGKDVSTKGSVYTVKPGAEVTFTVAPNPGYKAKWSDNVKEVTSGNPNVVTITPTAPDIITLDFVEDKENTSAITLNVDPNGVVKVEVDGTSLTPTGNVYTVENGKTVTFTAIPKTGFEVKEWKGATVDPTNKNVATLKVTKEAEVGVTFTEEDPDQTTDAIKILSMQVDGGKFENISQSVTTNVYSNTVDGAVYQIYASLSDPVAKFNANGEATFKFTLTAYSDSENFTGSAVTNFLEGLQIDTTRKVLMKELKPIESPTRELEITLSTEVIKSTDVDNPTEFTINFTYRGSADSNKVKPLVGKAIQIKATTEN